MIISEQNIRSFMIRADIEGLISLGAPQDEYDSEAGVLAEALSELSSNEFNESVVAGIITEIWKRSFNLSQGDLGQRQLAINSLASDIIVSYSSNS